MMKAVSLDLQSALPIDVPSDVFVATCLASAQAGDVGGYFDLGVAYSTGTSGVPCDLIEAHRWFNIAATFGHEGSALSRADIAGEMSARDIARAQRHAREWLSHSSRAPVREAA
jgi:TPR repeat protein